MGSIYTQLFTKALVAGAPPQTLKIANENAFCACKSELKMVLQRYSKMGSIHTQMLPKALAAELSPRPTNSEGERLRRLPV